MTKTLISVRLPETDLAALDRIAGSNGLNRSKVLEALVRSFVQEDFFTQRAVVRHALGLRHEAPEE